MINIKGIKYSSIASVLIIPAYLLSLLAFLTNIFIYPGFLENRFGINPFYFLVIFIGIGIYSLLTLSLSEKQSIYLRLFYLLNNKLILPGSFLAMTVFSILEVLNYENFVYSTFRIYYFDLVFVFLISYLATLIQIGKQRLLINYKAHLFRLSLLLLFLLWIISTRSDNFLTMITEEDNLVENAQFGLYLASGVLTFLVFRLFRKRGYKWVAALYLLVSLACFFTAGEEISWGQRILHLETPKFLQKVNVSAETNIHNTPFFFEKQYIVYTLLAFYGSFSWLLHKTFLKKRVGMLLNYFTPPLHLFLFFFPVLLYNTYYVYSIGAYDELEEFLEFMLAFGIAVFVLQVYLQVKLENQQNLQNQTIPSTKRG